MNYSSFDLGQGLHVQTNVVWVFLTLYLQLMFNTKIIYKRFSLVRRKKRLKIENHWVTITNAQHKLYWHMYSSIVQILRNSI
jgi:hypothetical protein